MLDPLWSLVTVIFATSTEPFLETEEQEQISDPEQIVAYLLSKAQITPSTLDQLKNAKRAAIKAYKHVLKTGQVLASSEVTSHRRSLCETCPFNQVKWGVRRCTKCGCNIKAKTATQTESCPIHKW
jgi:hypothetical protein